MDSELKLGKGDTHLAEAQKVVKDVKVIATVMHSVA